MAKLLKKLQIKNLQTTAYNPACKCLTEQINKVLSQQLTSCANKDPTHWDEYVLGHTVMGTVSLVLFLSQIAPGDQLYRTHAGVYFQELFPQLHYEETMPLVYSILLQQPSVPTKLQAWLHSACATRNSTVCVNAQEPHKVFSAMTTSIVDKFLNELSVSNQIKCGIKFPGDVASWCCDILTSRHLKSLMSNDEMLAIQLNELQNNRNGFITIQRWPGLTGTFPTLSGPRSAHARTYCFLRMEDHAVITTSKDCQAEQEHWVEAGLGNQNLDCVMCFFLEDISAVIAAGLVTRPEDGSCNDAKEEESNAAQPKSHDYTCETPPECARESRECHRHHTQKGIHHEEGICVSDKCARCKGKKAQHLPCEYKALVNVSRSGHIRKFRKVEVHLNPSCQPWLFTVRQRQLT
ncbi:hypothetical protein PR048_013680 [Dryococelus australis]|uniref:Uncharacterized protein n=1 Tax=Dryococelus australis TaxID=614101 RepID=A0ABQ9HT58_9NEOP|nr:hypothetical protein PR048_013680 [Dryococelus australis]